MSRDFKEYLGRAIFVAPLAGTVVGTTLAIVMFRHPLMWEGWGISLLYGIAFGWPTGLLLGLIFAPITLGRPISRSIVPLVAATFLGGLPFALFQLGIFILWGGVVGFIIGVLWLINRPGIREKS